LLDARFSAVFGKQRFPDGLKDNATSSVDAIVEKVYDRLNEFRRGAKAEDDISLSGLEYAVKEEGPCSDTDFR
jgi:serine phosphatase RsbU (regulator of sigma subunit)